MLGTLFLFLVMILVLLGAFFFFTPNQQEKQKETTETTDWEYQKERSKKESEAERKKKWFSEKRWLTDKEIDWACMRMKTSTIPGSFPGQELDKFKVLPAHQFHYVRETKGMAEAQAHLAFPELLNQINDNSKELVFIPVNNPDFHWSLLVYEVKSQKFWHYDTLCGANWGYVQPLVEDLCQQIQQTNQPNLSEYLIPKHDIRQGNGCDCGIATIAIIRRIGELWGNQSWIDKLKYGIFRLENDLGKFDFQKERGELRNEYLSENGEN